MLAYMMYGLLAAGYIEILLSCLALVISWCVDDNYSVLSTAVS